MAYHKDINIVLCELDMCKQLLKEALPFVNQMADECATGHIQSIDRLVLAMEAAILGESL